MVRKLLLQRPELAADFHARDRIERAERLVHQQDRWIDGKRAGEPHPLPLPSRQFVRTTGREGRRGQPHHLEELPCARPHAIGLPMLQPRDQRHVFLDGHVREEPDVLQHVSDASPQPDRIPFGSVAALDNDAAPGRQQQAVDQSENRRFSSAAAADDGRRLPGRDRQVETAQDRGAARMRERDILEVDDRLACHGRVPIRG